MAVRVDVNPDLIVWARARAGLARTDLQKRFPKLEDWERGDLSPTFKQLEGLARATHTPVGFLFLDEPPEEPVPIPDFRTVRNEQVGRPSPDLLDTIYHCQRRQDWYRTHAQAEGYPEVAFLASLSTATPAGDAAEMMRHSLRLFTDDRQRTFADAFRAISQAAEELGVLVMVSGVVGTNTHRKLDPQEFRGFALVDPLAPLVFVNGADTKGAQSFTLAHELAHLWLGTTGLSDADIAANSDLSEERWCNEVAAELLVPLATLTANYEPANDLTEELDRLARGFTVSSLVVLRRIHDAGFLTARQYRTAYQSELDRVLGILDQQAGGSGGDFYNTQPTRVSKSFARALITSTLEGRTLYTEAFQLLGVKKVSTFNQLAESLEVG